MKLYPGYMEVTYNSRQHKSKPSANGYNYTFQLTARGSPWKSYLKGWNFICWAGTQQNAYLKLDLTLHFQESFKYTSHFYLPLDW